MQYLSFLLSLKIKIFIQLQIILNRIYFKAMHDFALLTGKGVVVETLEVGSLFNRHLNSL